MKRFILFPVLLLFAAFPGLGQTGTTAGAAARATVGASSGWISYLDGESYDRAREAVTAAELQIESWLTAKETRTHDLQELYVSARRESWSEAEYRERLDAGGFRPSAAPASAERDATSETKALSAIRAALDTLGAVLRDQPPRAGSFSGRQAVSWLGEVAAVLGAGNEKVANVVRELQSQGQNAGNSAAGAFIASIDLPPPAGFGDASAQDQLTQVADHWWVLFLCASDDIRRAQMLADLGRAAQSVSADVGAAAADLSAQYRSADRQLRQLRDVVSDSLPSVNARSIAALGATNDRPPEGAPDNRSFARLLAELHGAGRADLVAAATVDAATRFTIEVTERLLAALSDRQALEVGTGAGLGIGDIRAIAARLYRVRLDLAAPEYAAADMAAQTAADRYRRSDAFRDQADLLRGYKQDGSDHFSGIQPWVTGAKTRAGDSFRWALLSILSNRYAQYLLLGDSDSADSRPGDPSLTEARRMVGGFATDLYEGVLQSLPDSIGGSLIRDTSGDVAVSYDRKYSLFSADDGAGSDLEQIYESFVREAQGDGDTRALFTPSSGSEPSISSDWSHTHGLHVSVITPDAPPSPRGDTLGDAALPWFNLANSAQVEMQGFGHAIRGVFALGFAIEELVQPALRVSGNPVSHLYEPRLSVARAHLATAGTFASPPGEILAALYGLYPEAENIAGLMDALERSAEALGNRLSDVEAADGRIIRLAAGASR